MKTIKFLTSIFIISILFNSCAKDEPAPVPNPNAVKQEFENKIETTIVDASSSQTGQTDSFLEVNANGILTDLSKMTLEVKLKHSFAKDLALILIPPGVGAKPSKKGLINGYENCFIFKVGGSDDYIETNLLRFNTSFTDVMRIQNNTIAAGNFKESRGDSELQVLNSLFKELEDKKVNGKWNLRIYDFNPFDTGNLISWKLIFELGAIQ
jgi:subtilisin-like proprotein convertase family protein